MLPWSQACINTRNVWIIYVNNHHYEFNSVFMNFLLIHIHINSVISVKIFKHLGCLWIVNVDHILHVVWHSSSKSDLHLSPLTGCLNYISTKIMIKNNDKIMISYKRQRSTLALYSIILIEWKPYIHVRLYPLRLIGKQHIIC